MPRGAPDYNQSVVAGGGAMIDGWQSLPQTPIYVSAYSFDYPGDFSITSATPIFVPGTKFQCVQGVVVKRFYVITSTFDGVYTRVTIYAGVDYTLVNGAITAAKISQSQIAPGFQEWFSIAGAGTWGSTGAMTATPTAYQTFQFKMYANSLKIRGDITFTMGGTPGWGVYWALPAQLQMTYNDGSDVSGGPAGSFGYGEGTANLTYLGCIAFSYTNQSLWFTKYGRGNWIITSGTYFYFNIDNRIS